MAIIKYLWGLMECYECQGECYLLGYPINATILSLIPLVFLLLIGIMFYYLIKVLRKKKNG